MASVLLLIVIMFTCISSRAKRNARVRAHANGREVRCYQNNDDELNSSCNFNNSSSISMERNLAYSPSAPQIEGEVIHYYSSNRLSAHTAAEKVLDDNSTCSMQNEDKENLATLKFSGGHGIIQMHANIAYKPILGESRTDSNNLIEHQNGAQDEVHYDTINSGSHCNDECGYDEIQSEDQSVIQHEHYHDAVKPYSYGHKYETIEDKRGDFDAELEKSEGYLYILRDGDSDSCETTKEDFTELPMSKNIAYGQSVSGKEYSAVAFSCSNSA